MVSSGNDILTEAPKRIIESGESLNNSETNDHTPLDSYTSTKGVVGDGIFRGRSQLKDLPGGVKVPKFSSSTGSLASPSARFLQIAEQRDEISRSVPSSTSPALKKYTGGVLSKKIDWPALRKISKEWLREPYNLILLFWIICVAVSGAILFLVMTGMLNAVLPKKSQRDAWFEVSNQIINALFTLMCLYQHPKRIHHFVLLCRWKPKDILELRKMFCKNGTYKPNEWIHMMIVILLLHMNCFAQYALCSLNLGYRRSERPAIGVAICLSVSIATPAVAGVYIIISPLGREYDSEKDEEAQITDDTIPKRHPKVKLLSEKRFSFAPADGNKVVEDSLVWRGGLFDFWDDISLAYLSLFCSFCVFGWNMERLGFGNMYVHIATFTLLCMAPFLIFNLAAVNINNEAIREAMGVTGVVLCLFGLLYGGFWRIQMRKRFNLPADNTCCGKPAVTDCAQWLLCCWCSLAQEVRTADSYDIVEDKSYREQSGHPAPPALSREELSIRFRDLRSSPPQSIPDPLEPKTEASSSPTTLSGDHSTPDRYSTRVEEQPESVDDRMKPPIPLLINRENNIDLIVQFKE